LGKSRVKAEISILIKLIEKLMSSLAPVALFVYNRPVHTQKTIEALRLNLLADQTELFIFSDAAKNDGDLEAVHEVRKVIQHITGFKAVTVQQKDENSGLANSIIKGVTEVINRYGRIIVLEDDLVTHPSFLNFMNAALDTYLPRKDIMSISGFQHPATVMQFPDSYAEDLFLSYRFSSWGWGTWKEAWDKVDWLVNDFEVFKEDRIAQNSFNKGGADLTDMLVSQQAGKINSWAIRFVYAHFKNQAFSICPRISYVQNIGFDGSGVNCEDDAVKQNFNNDAIPNSESHMPVYIQCNEEVLSIYRHIYRKQGLLKRVKNKLSKILNF
jgi:hypothetical protein